MFHSRRRRYPAKIPSEKRNMGIRKERWQRWYTCLKKKVAGRVPYYTTSNSKCMLVRLPEPDNPVSVLYLVVIVIV